MLEPQPPNGAHVAPPGTGSAHAAVDPLGSTSPIGVPRAVGRSIRRRAARPPPAGRVGPPAHPARRPLIVHHPHVTSPSEFTAAQAAFAAAAYGLGDMEAVTGPTGRGELGFVFRLTTSSGTWAVKRLIEPQLEVDVREDVGLVAAARATGVPTPAMATTAAGAVLLELPPVRRRRTEDRGPGDCRTGAGLPVGRPRRRRPVPRCGGGWRCPRCVAPH